MITVAAIAHFTTVRLEDDIFEAVGLAGTAATPYLASFSALRHGMHSWVWSSKSSERAGDKLPLK
jgi:hypothetical protein